MASLMTVAPFLSNFWSTGLLMRHQYPSRLPPTWFMTLHRLNSHHEKMTSRYFWRVSAK